MIRKLIVIGAVLLFLYVLSPLLAPIGMGTIFTILFYPWMKRIERGRFPNTLAAGLFTLTVTLLLFLPVCTMVVVGVKTGLSELKRIKILSTAPAATSSEDVLDKMLNSIGVDRLLARASKIAPVEPEAMAQQLKDMIANLALRLGDILSTFIGRIPDMLVAFSVFLFSLFYFLADGPRFLKALRKYSVFSPADTEHIMKVFSGLCRSVILASLISGSVQAFLAMVASFAAGISQFWLVFIVVFISSFIPLVGSFPVMLSITLYQFLSGHLTAGLILSGSTLVIVTIDNLIRPLVIRGGSDLHPLLGFASALGGLAVFGVTGVFLGPVTCGMCLEIFRTSSSNTA